MRNATDPIPRLPDHLIAQLDEIKRGSDYQAEPLHQRAADVEKAITILECSPVYGEEFWAHVYHPQVRALTLIWAERAKAILDDIVEVGQATRSTDG